MITYYDVFSKAPTSQGTWCYCLLSGWECQLLPIQLKSWMAQRTTYGHDCFVYADGGAVVPKGPGVLFIVGFYWYIKTGDLGNSHTLKKSVVAKFAKQSKWFIRWHFQINCSNLNSKVLWVFWCFLCMVCLHISKLKKKKHFFPTKFPGTLRNLKQMKQIIFKVQSQYIVQFNPNPITPSPSSPNTLIISWNMEPYQRFKQASRLAASSMCRMASRSWKRRDAF